MTPNALQDANEGHRRIACASLFYKSLISCSRCLDLCVLCREVEPVENHLKDMLQQLNGFLATKASEKAGICQGERTLLTSVDKSVLGSLFVHLCACRHCIQIGGFFCFVFVISRRRRGSSMYTDLLDQQMGGLL